MTAEPWHGHLAPCLNNVNGDVLRHRRTISAPLLPIFLIGQLLCFCVAMDAAAHTKINEADHACCSQKSTDADRDKPPADKKHDCDHCRGAQALIAQQTPDQARALKPLAATASPFIQTTAMAAPSAALPGFSKTITLERAPSHLFVWHCALLN